ncbi:hypothetical protein O7606_14475 [Micromonospora sp. WMMD882]|uniref:hypothetical protein n=1 Tax=Micromonospora sp. WMMD882 TaxID=3015151 RepID=UPI00248D0A08|nr:hypothetical protein [Micromonospora sp. WMMD882]WBB77492.1 hypothetical protein O7606_14475 [Micromonospora sp. WMMD882]
MIDPGTPTSSLTNWNNMNVVTMWATLQDQRTDNHWRQVAGWRKTSELALTHLSRLQEYRRGLAEAWPPEKSAASRAYLAELDDLITRVRSTYDAAVANCDALAAATSAISTTRTELKKLFDQFEEKNRIKLAYEESLPTRPLPRAGRSAPAQPPVTDADLERLNSQARTLMYGLSGELQQAQALLKPPPPPLPPSPRGRQDGNPDIYGGGSAPVIPPIVPVPLSPSASSRSGGGSASPVRPVPTPTASGVGPVLGGAGPGLLPPQVNPTMPTVTPPTTSPGPALGPGPTPPLPGSGPLPRGPIDATPGRGGGPVGPASRPAIGGTPPIGPRAMPPGGLIGGTPGMGLGQPAPGATPPRRVNPVGGVIGGGAAGTAPAGAAGSRPGVGRGPSFGGMAGGPFGGAPGYGSPTGRPSRRDRDETEGRRWDPDNPWETELGVDPIVLPPDEDGPIDPGPAIGFNR